MYNKAIDLNEFMRSHNGYEVLGRVCGLEPRKYTPSYRMYNCPLHDDKNASLMVLSTGMMQCKAGCSINGRSMPNWASYLDLIIQLRGVKLPEAIKLVDHSPSGFLPQRPQCQVHKEKRWTPSLENIRQWSAAKTPKTKTYYSMRGISSETQDWLLLGEKQHQMKEDYIAKGGLRIKRRPALRYTIPIFRTRPTPLVAGVVMRRSDLSCQRDWEYMTIAARRDAVKVIQDLDGDDSDLWDMLYGPKYITFGAPQIYMWHELTKWDSKTEQWMFPETERVFIVESQIDAIMLHEHGVKAIATKGNLNLARLLQNVAETIIIPDNDDPGLNIANVTAKSTGKTLGKDLKIMQLPSYAKDPSEMYETGTMNEWLMDNQFIKEEKIPSIFPKPEHKARLIATYLEKNTSGKKEVRHNYVPLKQEPKAISRDLEEDDLI